MLTYVFRRLVLMIPTLVGMTFLLFFIIRQAPGLTSSGAFSSEGSRQARELRVEAERNAKRRLHLIDDKDQPIPLTKQYLLWINDVLHGDFGESGKQSGVAVSQLIIERLPRTLTLNIIEVFIVYLIALPGGMLAAVKRGKTFDLVWGLASLGLYCLPVIVVGDLAIAMLANPGMYNWFPSSNLHSIGASEWRFSTYVGDYLWHLILPVLVASYGGFAYLSKLMRGSILDNLYMDYARTARAKGLPESTVISRHVFRNSLLPMITVFAGVFPGLLAGSVIIEYIFSIDGMGRLMLDAARQRDLPVLEAVGLITATLSLVALLIRDICYAIADPRVSYD